VILIFLGPPGSGKGTQAKMLAEKKQLPHISLGDILRAEVKLGSAIGQKAQGFMAAGKLVPDELTIELTRQRLAQPDCRGGFIIDGFPRSMAQAEALAQMFAAQQLEIDQVIYFKVAEEEVVKRLLLRAGIEGRADDNAAAIRTRFEVYARSTQPLIDYYQRQGKLKEIDAAQPIERVFQQLL
jgi:adenylate kinase